MWIPETSSIFQAIDRVYPLSAHNIVDVGYTEEIKADSYDKYLHWIDRGYAHSLKYMWDERRLLRSHVTKIYPACQSLLIFLFSYREEQLRVRQNERVLSSKLAMNGGLLAKIASYVMGFGGIDYHFTVKDDLKNIMEALKETQHFKEGLEYELAVDSKPLLEREFALKAGLGWIGKNSMLISKKHGSYFMIGTVMLNQKLRAIKDQDFKENKYLYTDHCGHCTRCVDACPTKAIDGDTRTLVAEKCISQFTIEQFRPTEPPRGMSSGGGSYFYGCDICQEVCPWNYRDEKKRLDHSFNGDHLNLRESSPVEQFFYRENEGDRDKIKSSIEKMSGRQFRKIFKSTPLGRTGKIGVLKNLF